MATRNSAVNSPVEGKVGRFSGVIPVYLRGVLAPSKHGGWEWDFWIINSLACFPTKWWQLTTWKTHRKVESTTILRRVTCRGYFLSLSLSHSCWMFLRAWKTAPAFNLQSTWNPLKPVTGKPKNGGTWMSYGFRFGDWTPLNLIMTFDSYCWWNESCTTQHVWNPVNNGEI